MWSYVNDSTYPTISHVVNLFSVNSCKNNLDIFRSNEEVYYNIRCDII